MSTMPIAMGIGLLFPLAYLGAFGVAVYWAVRLAIRHERYREASLKR